MESITRNIVSNDWVTLVLLSILLLISLAKSFYAERFYDFFRIIFSNKYFTTHKKSTAVLDLFSFILFVVHLLCVSLALYFLFIIVLGVAVSSTPFIEYTQVFLGYSMFMGMKYLVEKIIGNIFSIEIYLDSYIFYKITNKNFISIVILPLIILFIYVWKPTLYVVLAGALLFLMANTAVLIGYYRRKQKLFLANWFYFILYLCALEIAPYFILYKVITHTS